MCVTTDCGDDVNKWKSKLCNILDDDKMIAHWKIYSTPLEAISKRLSNAKFGGNRQLHHRFIVCSLTCPTSNDVPQRYIYLSLEKGTTGIIAQISDKEDTVKNKLKSEDRKDKPELVKEQVKTGKLFDVLLRMGMLLETWEMELAYSLLSDNCQKFTSEVKNMIIRNTTSIKMRLPGKESKVDFDSDEILNHVQAMYPKWMEKTFTTIPERSSPFAFVVEGAVPEVSHKYKTEQYQANYDELKYKQKIFFLLLY